MNNTNSVSALQQQYPLSPKKFWKKIISQIPGFLILGAFIAFCVGVFVTGLGDPHIPRDTVSLFWTTFIFGTVTILIVGLSLYAIYVKAYIRKYYYSTDKDFITIKKGVFTPKEIHVQYLKIQDVYVDQDLLDRMLGLFDVHIASATAGSAMEAHIDGVDTQTAEGLKNLFLDTIRNGGSRGESNNSVSSMSHTSAPVTVNLTEKFSSENYPIEPKWIYAQFSFLPHLIYISFLLCIFANDFLGGNNASQQISAGYPVQGYSIFSNFNFSIYFGILIILTFCSIIYKLVWKRNYRFEFTPEYIFTHEGVWSIKEAHTPYSTVQDVIVSQGFLDRMFGLYKVMIQNAANNGAVYGRRGAVFQGVVIPGQTKERSEKIADFLKSILASKNMGRTGL